MILLNRGVGKDWAGPFSPPLQNVTFFLFYLSLRYVHQLLVNSLFKPAQEKVWLGEPTVPQWP